jgi:uncharacterized membrane protein
LSVTVPTDALGCTRDNVAVRAIGTGVENSATCVAHAAVVRGVKVSISPDYQSGLPGETLNYVITVRNTGNVEDSYDLSVGDDLNWSLLVSPTLLVVPVGGYGTATLSVTIPSGAYGNTIDNIIVTAISVNDLTVSDSATCVAHVTAVREVEVNIWPDHGSALPGGTLIYAVTVINSGNVEDTYDLTVTDNAGWSLSISPPSLTVPPRENREAILSVLVPENAYGSSEDNVTATAVSTTDPTVSDSASCIASAALVRGVTVTISPIYRGGLPGGTLAFTVTVKNTGNVWDNFVLTVLDNAGWGPIVSPTSIMLAPSASDNATLSVVIPDNALPCTMDNIAVVAVSADNAEVSASGTCVAHAVGMRTEMRMVVYPIADVYAYGEYGKGYSRTQLKFDISGIPPGSEILSAKLWLYRWSASSWDGNITLYRVDDQLWSEAISATEFDAQELTNEEYFAGKFMLSGWDHLSVINQLMVDYAAAHAYTSFRLMLSSDNRSEPSLGIDDGRFLVINSEADEVNIIFCSSEYDGRDPYLEVTYVPPYAVSASILPNCASGLPGTTLTYVITIANTGNLEDTYDLTVIDNAGWHPSIFPTSLTLTPSTLGEATLSVTVPEDAAPCMKDNILVTAISRGDPTVRASASCLAHRVKAEFKLENLYKISLDIDVYVNEGSRLVILFYTYTGAYQGESVVWSGITPTQVTLLENVPHPDNKPIENATLVLTDEEGNVLWVITSFIVRRSHLAARMAEIRLMWRSGTSAERGAWAGEISAIRLRWRSTPA